MLSYPSLHVHFSMAASLQDVHVCMAMSECMRLRVCMPKCTCRSHFLYHFASSCHSHLQVASHACRYPRLHVLHVCISVSASLHVHVCMFMSPWLSTCACPCLRVCKSMPLTWRGACPSLHVCMPGSLHVHVCISACPCLHGCMPMSAWLRVHVCMAACPCKDAHAGRQTLTWTSWFADTRFFLSQSKPCQRPHVHVS